jgi:hypothetical protein
VSREVIEPFGGLRADRAPLPDYEECARQGVYSRSRVVASEVGKTHSGREAGADTSRHIERISMFGSSLDICLYKA